MEVVGNGVVVDLRQRTLLGADRRGEIPEMISCQRNVGGQRLPNRLAVVPDFGERERVFVRVNAIGDLVQDRRPLGRGGLAPPRGGRVRGVECLFDVGLIRARHLAERLAGDRRRVLEVQTLGWRDPLAPDEVVVPGLIRHQRPGGAWTCENSHLLGAPHANLERTPTNHVVQLTLPPESQWLHDIRRRCRLRRQP